MVVKPSLLPTYLQTNNPLALTLAPTINWGTPHEFKSASSHQQGVGYMVHTISSMHDDDDDDVSTLKLEVAK